MRTRIIAVVLAAGKSSRMKTNKLALSLQDTTIGAKVLQKAILSNLFHSIVVTKPEDSLDWLSPCLLEPNLKNRWSTVACQDADRGQAHSLICGIQAAIEQKPQGIMVLLADQPFISIQLINTLIDQFHRNKDASYVAARYQGIPRPPIIFAPEIFPQLLELKGDEGARKLFQQKKESVIFIDDERELNFIDIDTRQDYEQWKGVKIDD